MSGKISHDDDHLDFGKIEKEVQSAVVNEEKYWRENSAKIRAVEQRVPTYDDFRDLVLAAHLKPLEKGDKISDMGVFTQVWNQAAHLEKAAESIEEHDKLKNRKTDAHLKQPKSGQEFAQAWRRLPKVAEDKKQFLFFVGPDNISSLFKTEISGGLLGEFFDCLQIFDDAETDIVLGLLEAFSKSQRFSLSLAFLSKNEKSSGASIFSRLKSSQFVQNAVESTRRVEALEKIYKVG